MPNKQDEFDPTKPALVLLFGNTNKKCRLLDRDVILVGRARGCDLGLEAPDISSIHCIVTRGASGFAVRDCQSRAGTKVNGNAVREAPLRDGDLLQVGPFSFRVHLPAGCQMAVNRASNQSRLHHVERSRRNLARIALRHRKLLRLLRAVKADATGKGSAAFEQLSKQASALKARIRDYDKRVGVLEDAERDLSNDRETLAREQAAFRIEIQQHEQENAQRLQQVEAEIETRRQQFEQHCRQEEQRLLSTSVPLVMVDKEDSVDLGGANAALQQERERLEQQQRELHAQAEQMEQMRRELEERAVQLQQQRDEEWQRRLGEVRQQEADLQALLARHQERDRQTNEWAQQLKQREHTLQELQARLTPQRQEQEAAQRRLAEQQRETEKLAAQWQERGAQLQTRAAQLEEQQKQLQERGRQTNERAQQLKLREHTLQELQERLTPQLQEQEAAQRRLAEQQREIETLAAQWQERGADLQTRAAQLDEQQKQLHNLTRQQEQQQRDLEAQARLLQHREQQLQECSAPLEQRQAHLADDAEQLARQTQQLDEKRQTLEQQQKELAMLRDQWTQDQLAILDRLGHHKTAMALAEETLREQRRSLDDLLNDLQTGGGTTEGPRDGELKRLLDENAQMRQLLAERGSGTADDDELRRLKDENADLKHLVAAVEQEREHAEAIVAEVRAGATQVPPPSTDAAEVAALRQQVADKEAQLERLRRQPARSPAEQDVANYEAELTEFRCQLETDRQKLKQEFEQLRNRNTELDQATREMELEMSRERADLARERQKLERLRDEVRAELERFQRDSGMRERLAPVQNLRDELNNRRLAAKDETPRLGKEDPVQAKLRSLRNRIAD
jgi:chromosome segregation ATPase